MIRKYLSIDKHLHLSSRRIEDSSEHPKVTIVELLMPLDVFWDLEKLLKRIAYLSASHEDQLQINDCTLRIYKMAARYATQEQDRHFLQERLAAASSGNASS